MNWKAEAVKDLKNYPQRKESIENIKTRIKILDEEFTSLRGISTSDPVMGGFSRQEEKMLDNISERELLSFSLKIAEALVKLTEKGLEVLDKKEREVIEGFYINREGNHVDMLCEKLHFEKTRLYEIKDNALRKFTIAMYGTVEI
ncbi:MAG: hypothetical protein U0M06_14415 [Clostridia bacterium]|nr:hypothetical protein [Clostridia bacterium]